MTQSNRLSELCGRMLASRARAGSSAFSGKSLFREDDGDLSISAQPVISGIELAHICNANTLCLGRVGETNMCFQVLSLPIFVMQIHYVWAKWERQKCVYRS